MSFIKWIHSYCDLMGRRVIGYVGLYIMSSLLGLLEWAHTFPKQQDLPLQKKKWKKKRKRKIEQDLVLMS